MTDDIEVFKSVKLRSKKNDDNNEKEYDEINRMYMRDDKDFYEREKIDKNDKERVTNDIEVLKLGKRVPQRNIDSIEK